MENSDSSDTSPNLSKTQPWQRFTFFCDTAKEKKPQFGEQCFEGSDVFPLSQAQVGWYVCIIELQPPDSVDHLTGMGFIKGAELQIISCTETGSVIVALQNKNLGLAAEMAQKIMVTQLQ